MIPSLEFLQRCAADTGYPLSSLEKVVRLGQMAADIARHPFLGEALALKGGTALNLCYGSPSRLSVDLDYNYVAQVERKRMLSDRTRVENAVLELAGRHGYGIQKSADSFAGRKIFLHYRSVMGQQERIEVDLNFLLRLPLTEIEKRGAWQPGGLDQPAIRVVGLGELLTGKLLAFLDRCAARDAWDIAHLSESAVRMLQSQAFRAHFIALSAILEHPLPDYTFDRVRTLLTERAVTEQLLPMLSSKFAQDARELLEKAWERVSPLLILETDEEEYIASVQKGNLRLELLFAEDRAERNVWHTTPQFNGRSETQYPIDPEKGRNRISFRMGVRIKNSPSPSVWRF